MNKKIMVKKQFYMGLFMVTLATLMYEILLTRIFSVTMWYHFAFVAISVAMFGMTVGALLVYLFPNYFRQEQVKYHLVLSSLFFSISIVVSFLIHIRIPFNFSISIVNLCTIALTYAVLSIPFIFSGVCVCLVLTKFPQQVSKLYAADLTGAAGGCILLIYILKIADGPTSVIIVAFLASIGAVLFAANMGFDKLMRIAVLTSILLGSFAGVHIALANKHFSLLQLKWVKGRLDHYPLYEKWNSFSRVMVWGNPNKLVKPFGWGLSSAYTSDHKVRQLFMDIDADAGTYLTAFDDNLSTLEFLKYDVVNLAHYLRSDSKVLVVGTGGGRDILSALVFRQKNVTGVEINENIIKAVNHRFGDFTGHLDRNPKVTFVNDEARSYISRSGDRFDIIQVSLIDTWAATAAGAFVLTENSLYTIEAWKVLIEHLTHKGILTFSRWYVRDTPYHMYRLTSLASTSLKQLGIKNPRNHILIVRHMPRLENGYALAGIGTILVSKEPFSNKDLDIIERIVRNMQFDIVLTPRFSLDSSFASIASEKDFDLFIAKFPININAPTDNNPFFFNMLRLRDIFSLELWKHGYLDDINMRAVLILSALFVTVVVFTFLCIIIPLILTTKKETLLGTLPLFIFFACIGFGFMFVEISQMQRLIIFLGHPSYSLSVVLFSLLLSSGLGSYLTQRLDNIGMSGSAIICVSFLMLILIVFGRFTPYAISVFKGSTTTNRILVSTLILFPLGLFMGMAFPIGMKIASERATSLTPWFWGINGATSVCGSVLAVAIALNFGISILFWSGSLCYFISFIAFVFASRRKGLVSNL